MRRTRYTPVGIEIGGRLIRMVQFAQTGSAVRLHSWAVFPRLDSKSELAQEIERIAATFDRRGFVGRDVAFCLPDEDTLSAVLELPPMKSGAPVHSIAGVEIGRMFKHSPQELELALWELPTNSRQAGAVASMVVACPHTTSQPIIDAFETRDLTIRAIEPRCTALVRACCRDGGSAESLEIILSLGWTHSRLYAACSGVVVLERVMENADLETLHRVIAGTIGVDTDLASIAIRDALRGERELLTDPDATREIQEQFRHYCDVIAAETLTAVSYLSRRYAGRRVSGLLLLCDGDEASDLTKDLAARLSMESRVCSLTELNVDGVERIDPATRRALVATAGLCLIPNGGEA
ncbi:MAG: hypothetical protein KF691_11295 [Phycisphaeraceae bacterium]|nr:hypothetical protein [Phycisphaeraceae bacterium]